MGRPLRCREPGTYHFSTTRCLESRFFLRPDTAMNALFGYWLARSLREFPAISLHGVVAMSNHVHLLTRDDGGVLSEFFCYFLGNLSKAVNKLRGRTGPLFHRRFDDGGRVLDARAAAECLAYLIVNPVKAGLVTRHGQWPGVLIYAKPDAAEPQSHHYVWFDREGWLDACRRATAGRPVDPEPFHYRESLVVHPLSFAVPAQGVALIGARRLLDLAGDEVQYPTMSSSGESTEVCGRPGSVVALELVRSLEEAERSVRNEQGRAVLGPDRVVAQDPRARPRDNQRSTRALAHASDGFLWGVFAAAMAKFTAWYREAAMAFKKRNWHFPFPPFSLLPGGTHAT